ncbi:hypothetical protein ILUMI_06637 [Ignelater luminosus]|uniref:Gag protein n=1 Tax=Ignelater luminosus TaxID=2038154 RepID=A0A8K0GH11_IGNLU|nr:hypothetical protein ILUMI_06637 [Ignelater luminosus]
MSATRDRSPIRFNKSELLNGLGISSPTKAVSESLIMANYAEINIAKETIPIYKGGSKNLSYFLQQCQKFIVNYKNNTVGQENCSLNKLLFEICCSKLIGAARDTLVISNCNNWSQVKETLISRFGDQRNETLLENELVICYQLVGETYDQYYEKIKCRVQQLLEHVAMREQNGALIGYNIGLYNQKALDTFKAGLLEPYRSFISYKNVGSLEDCLVQLRGYDNHKQQVNFLNFIRQKTTGKTNQPKFRTSNNTNIPSANNYNNSAPVFSQNQNQIRTTPNFQNRPIQNTFPNTQGTFNHPNRQVQNKFLHPQSLNYKKVEQQPTPMSISTRNTTRVFQNKPQARPSYFTSTGPQNFISEEIYNVEEQEPQEGFENFENVEDLSYNDDNQDYNKEQTENFQLDGSESLN